MAETKEWEITGTVTLRGVIAVVEADSEEDARAKAKNEGADWMLEYGELVDWEVTYVNPAA